MEDALIRELPLLRTKIGLSQNELAEIVGISRQTLSAIETGRRDMTWNMFITLVRFNKATRTMLKDSGAWTNSLENLLNTNKRDEA